MNSKTFRIFISSTFKDFLKEREILNNKIFKELDEYCRYRGYGIQFVDLRWGVSTESALNQKTMPICLGEVERCNRMSPRPNFIAMVGERYGWIPLPYSIEKDEFLRIDKNIGFKQSVLINKWYKLDENNIVPEYVLVAREGIYEDTAVWEEEEKQLKSIFRFAIDNGFVTEEEKEKYLTSATQQEIIEGLLSEQKNSLYTITVFKSFDDAKINQNVERVKSLIRQRYERDQATENLLSIAVDSNYYSNFENALKEALIYNIDKEIERINSEEQEISENDRHFQFAQDMLSGYVPGESYFEIEQYVLKKDICEKNTPFFVIGDSGTGKTADLAAIAVKYNESGINRFYGATYGSTSLTAMMRSIIEDILLKYDYGFDSTIGKNNITCKFTEYLNFVPEDEELLIILDGIDTCHDIDEYMENVFPYEIPRNIKLIISMETNCKLLEVYRDCPSITLDAMNEADGEMLFHKLILQNNRKIRNVDHLDKISKSLQVKKSPLFIRMMASYCSDLKSFDMVEDMPQDEETLCLNFLNSLWAQKGHSRRTLLCALSLIAYSPNGLTDDEVLKLLYSDSKIREEIDSYYEVNDSINCQKRIPYVVWSRIYFDLDGILNYREIEGDMVIQFSHRIFSKIIKEKYPDEYKKAGDMLISYFKEQKCYVDEKLLIPNKRGTEIYLRLLVKNDDVEGLKGVIGGWKYIDAAIKSNMLLFLLEVFGERYFEQLNETERSTTMLLKRNRVILQCYPDRFIQILFQNNYTLENFNANYWFFKREYNTMEKDEGHYIPPNSNLLVWNNDGTIYAYLFQNIIFCNNYETGKQICKINIEKGSGVKQIIWLRANQMAIVCSRCIYIYNIDIQPVKIKTILIDSIETAIYNPPFDYFLICNKGSTVVIDVEGNKKYEFKHRKHKAIWSKDYNHFVIITPRNVKKLKVDDFSVVYNKRTYWRQRMFDDTLFYESKDGEYLCINILDSISQKKVNIDIKVLNESNKKKITFNYPRIAGMKDIIFSSRNIVILYSNAIIAYDLYERCCLTYEFANCDRINWCVEDQKLSVFRGNKLHVISLDAFEKMGMNIDPLFSTADRDSTMSGMLMAGSTVRAVVELMKDIVNVCSVGSNYEYQVLLKDYNFKDQYFNRPTRIAVSNDGKKAVCFEWADRIIVLNPNNAELFRIVNLKFRLYSTLFNLRFSPCGDYLLLHRGYRVQVYHISSQKCILNFNTYHRPVLHIDFLEDSPGMILKLADGKEYRILFKGRQKIKVIGLPKNLTKQNPCPMLYTEGSGGEHLFFSILSVEDNLLDNYNCKDWFSPERYIFQYCNRQFDGFGDESKQYYGFVSFYKNGIYLYDLADSLIASFGYKYILLENILQQKDSSEAETYMRNKSELASEVINIDDVHLLIVCNALNSVFIADLDRMNIVAAEYFEDNIIGHYYNWEKGAVDIYTNNSLEPYTLTILYYEHNES